MSIDWFTFAAQIVNFAILVYALNYFLYAPITKAMSDRELMIAEQLRDAESREKDAQSTIDKYQSLSDDIDKQRQEFLEQATVDSEQVRQRLILEAREDVQQRKDEWLSSLQRERDSLIALVQKRAGQQVVAVANQTLDQLADENLEQLTIQKFLDAVTHVSADERQRITEEANSRETAHVHTAFKMNQTFQQEVSAKLQTEFNLTQLAFHVTPELVFGIELHVGGLKIGWSVQESLETLKSDLDALTRR
ncbi:MAG: F0F1 ATP synthase subunit delta [Planctomycetota bacterium]